MPALVAGIHVLTIPQAQDRGWPGQGPAMTKEKRIWRCLASRECGCLPVARPGLHCRFDGSVLAMHDQMKSRQRGIHMHKLRLAVLVGALLAASPALAVRCGGDFGSFISSFSAEA